MTRVDLDTPYSLTSKSWSLYINGLDINQDLLFESNGKTMLISDPDANFSSLGFLSPIPGNRMAFHIDLSRVPANCSEFSLLISARREAFMDWYLKSPEGHHFDAEGLRIFSGDKFKILEFGKSADWALRSRKIDLTQPEDAPAQNRRLPENLRELHQLAANLDLAPGVEDVAVVVDSSASMLEVQRDPKFLLLVQAVQAISLTVSLEPLKIRFAGLKKVLKLGPLDDLEELVSPAIRLEGGAYREVEPMMNLVPSSLSNFGLVQPGGRLYCISDTWFFISSELAGELESKNISLVIIKLVDSETEDEPIRFVHPNVSLKTVVGLEKFTSADAILRALA
jgi:hypothetical protein